MVGANAAMRSVWQHGLSKCLRKGLALIPMFFTEEDPYFPALRLLFLCLVCRALHTGSFSRIEHSNHTISDLRVTILKLVGSCEGTCKVSNFIRFLSDKSISRESESDSLLSSPGNHCDYRQDLKFIIVVASLRAARNFAVCSVLVSFYS